LSRIEKKFLGVIRKAKRKCGVPFVDVEIFGDLGPTAASMNESVGKLSIK
jgi:hypothetical protein